MLKEQIRVLREEVPLMRTLDDDLQSLASTESARLCSKVTRRGGRDDVAEGRDDVTEGRDDVTEGRLSDVIRRPRRANGRSDAPKQTPPQLCRGCVRRHDLYRQRKQQKQTDPPTDTQISAKNSYAKDGCLRRRVSKRPKQHISGKLTTNDTQVICDDDISGQTSY